jgi:hypothetical protein
MTNGSLAARLGFSSEEEAGTKYISFRFMLKVGLASEAALHRKAASRAGQAPESFGGELGMRGVQEFKESKERGRAIRTNFPKPYRLIGKNEVQSAKTLELRSVSS